MRFTLALAALVVATSALPSALQSMGKYTLDTREDFVEDDFDIQVEADDLVKRAGGWPEDDFDIGVPAHLRFKDKKTRDTDFPEDDFEIAPKADD